MYQIRFAKQFRKSLKRIIRSGSLKHEQVETVINSIATAKTLDQKYHDHSLAGEFTGYRECHIKPNVLLIYKIEKKILILVLVDIGSHADLFGK